MDLGAVCIWHGLTREARVQYRMALISAARLQEEKKKQRSREYLASNPFKVSYS